MVKIDIEEVKRTLDVFKKNALIEVRTAGKPIKSGYFRDMNKLMDSIKNQHETWYFVLNEIKDECYSKEQREKIAANPKSTTKDSDISGRDWILVDIDPKRSSDTSASDEQKANAKETIGRIYKYLEERGFERAVIADSGNGYHLLYRISSENDIQSTELIKKFLWTLDMLFTDEKVSVDTSVFNASRITKLYGTPACKGADAPESPHRLSRLIYVPPEIKITGLGLVQQIIDENRPKDEETKAEQSRYGYKSVFDLREFIAKHGIRVTSEIPFEGGTKYILENCIFDSSHRGKDAALLLLNSGAIVYKCFHASCSCYKWQDVRLKYEANAYKPIDGKPKPNYQNPNYKPFTVLLGEDEKPKISDESVKDAPIFYTTEQIRQMKRPPEEFIKTGIHVIDRKSRGLKKGLVTCLTGLRGGGKSSLVSQFTLEAVEQGYKVVLFSGELDQFDTMDWLTLQAAGKDYVYPTQYENYWRVGEDAAENISKWLDDKLYIYNNDYGNEFKYLLKKMNEKIAETKADLVILDNLMSINIGLLDNDRNARQSKFSEMLKIFARATNTHVIFVAHPKKSQGFLRLDDVSGSGDITNWVDNAYVIHRVNNDFKSKTKKEYLWNDSNPLYQCQNVIEVCKDRKGGMQDEFIPLYFEKSCKRLKNTQYENKNYSWRKPKTPYDDNSNMSEVTDENDLPIM